MRKRVFKTALVVSAACTVLLSGCSDFDEMKSKRLLTQAEILLEQGDELQAEQILTDLLAKYPATQTVEIASKHLYRIQRQRELGERAAFANILYSYQQVLNGYQALNAEYPLSIAALDQSDYFFDSAYLKEITPDGYQVYLWLKSDGSDFALWSVSQEKVRGYSLEGVESKLSPFERDEFVAKMKTRFQATDWSGKLVVLQLQN